jgi:hypothetical protein
MGSIGASVRSEKASDQETAGRSVPKPAANPVERALLGLADPQADPRGVVRDLARLLETRRFDWRDLVRALSRIEAEAARPTALQPDAETPTVAAAARSSSLDASAAVDQRKNYSLGNYSARVQQHHSMGRQSNMENRVLGLPAIAKGRRRNGRGSVCLSPGRWCAVLRGLGRLPFRQERCFRDRPQRLANCNWARIHLLIRLPQRHPIRVAKS